MPTEKKHISKIGPNKVILFARLLLQMVFLGLMLLCFFITKLIWDENLLLHCFAFACVAISLVLVNAWVFIVIYFSPTGLTIDTTNKEFTINYILRKSEQYHIKNIKRYSENYHWTETRSYNGILLYLDNGDTRLLSKIHLNDYREVYQLLQGNATKNIGRERFNIIFYYRQFLK